MKVNLMIPGH